MRRLKRSIMKRLLDWVAGATIIFAVMSGTVHAAERRVALVVGNATYNAAYMSLPNPRNDAEDISALLKGELGFEVVTAVNATKRDMETKLQEFARLAIDADSALFFYAGHAMQFQGRNYLMPTDAELEDEFSVRFQTVSLDEVNAALERVNGVKILILDACRDNPLAKSLQTKMAGASRSVGMTRGLARVDKTQGTVIAYATSPDDVAADGRGRNSPFTSALLKRLREPGVEIGIMLRRIAADVNQQTNGRQRPETTINLLSEYYLNQNDRIAWERLNQDDVAALRDFVSKYPASPLAINAQRKVDLLERAAREREEQARIAAEQRRREEQARIAEEQKRREEQARIAEEQKRREEQARIAAEQRRRDEQARIAEEQKRRDEQARVAEEQKRRDEQARVAEEQKRRDEQARVAEEQKRRDEQARVAAEQKRRDDQAQVAAEQKRRDEQARVAEEQKRRDEQARVAEEQKRRDEQARIAEEQKRRDEQARVAEEQKRRDEQARMAEEQKRREDQARMAEAQKRREDQARMAEEQKRREDQVAALEAQKEQKLQEEQKRIAALPPASTTPSSQAAPQPEAPKANLPEQIHQAQTELKRLGCLEGKLDGKMDTTEKAIRAFWKRSNKRVVEINITDDFIADLQRQPDDFCPGRAPAVANRPATHTRPHEPAQREARPQQPGPQPTARATAESTRPQQPAPQQGGARATGIGF